MTPLFLLRLKNPARQVTVFLCWKGTDDSPRFPNLLKEEGNRLKGLPLVSLNLGLSMVICTWFLLLDIRGTLILGSFLLIDGLF